MDGIVSKWETVGAGRWEWKRAERAYIVYDRERDACAAVALGTRDHDVLSQL